MIFESLCVVTGVGKPKRCSSLFSSECKSIFFLNLVVTCPFNFRNCQPATEKFLALVTFWLLNDKNPAFILQIKIEIHLRNISDHQSWHVIALALLPLMMPPIGIHTRHPKVLTSQLKRKS